MGGKLKSNDKEKLLAQIYEDLSELSEANINILLGSARLLLASQQMEEEKINEELKGEGSNEQKENPYTISKV